MYARTDERSVAPALGVDPEGEAGEALLGAADAAGLLFVYAAMMDGWMWDNWVSEESINSIFNQCGVGWDSWGCDKSINSIKQSGDGWDNWVREKSIQSINLAMDGIIGFVRCQSIQTIHPFPESKPPLTCLVGKERVEGGAGLGEQGEEALGQESHVRERVAVVFGCLYVGVLETLESVSLLWSVCWERWGGCQTGGRGGGEGVAVGVL